MKRLLVLVVALLLTHGWARTEAESESETETQAEAQAQAQVSAALAQHSHEAAEAHVEVAEAIAKAYRKYRKSGISSPACATAVVEARKAALKAATCRRNLKRTLSRAVKLSKQAKAQRKKGGKPLDRDAKWGEIVRQSRALLKRTTDISKLLAKQLTVYEAETRLDGKKGEWKTIWDYIKGIKSGKPFSDKAKEINGDVERLMAPFDERVRLENAADDTTNLLKDIKNVRSAPFTRSLRGPAFDWLIRRPAADEYTLPRKSAKIKFNNNLKVRFAQMESESESENEAESESENEAEAGNPLASNVFVPNDYEPTNHPLYERKPHVHIKTKLIPPAVGCKSCRSKPKPKAAPKPKILRYLTPAYFSPPEQAVIAEAEAVEPKKPLLNPNKQHVTPIIRTEEPKADPTQQPTYWKKTPNGLRGKPLGKVQITKFVEHNPTENNPHLKKQVTNPEDKLNLIPEYR